MPYLSYLSLVRGVGLDYPTFCSAGHSPARSPTPRTTAAWAWMSSCSTVMLLAWFSSATRRQAPRQQLKWPLGRMLLHRGDPDLGPRASTTWTSFATAVDAVHRPPALEPLRDFYSRSRNVADQPDSARDYFSTAIARLHAAQVLLFNIGQIDRPPSRRIDAGHLDRSPRAAHRAPDDPCRDRAVPPAAPDTPTSTDHKPSVTPATHSAAWCTG